MPVTLNSLGAAALNLAASIAIATVLLASAPLALAATTVYLNRCSGNCQFTEGPDDSVLNSSSVLTGTRVVTEYAHGDVAFNAVRSCVADLLAPFDIVVTTTDPAPAVHIELVIAGTSTQAGLPVGVAGIAPSNCTYIAGAPAFVFANSIGNALEPTCWTAVSQVGAIAGLEPLFNCPDVMSYLTGCGPKSFRNEASACGTFAASTCFCGGTSRNSFATMRNVFGVTDPLFDDGFE